MSDEIYTPLRSPYHPLKHLAAIRHAYKDEVPAQIVHSNDPDNRYKVRGAWWCGVIGNLENATIKGIITDEELKRSIDEFTDKVQAMQFGDDTPASLRTAEEIKWANEFIDKVLEQTGYANVLLDLSLLGPKIR